MKRKIGTISMVLGAALVLAALSLFAFNQYENWRAEKSVEEILPQVVEQIQAQIAAQSAGAAPATPLAEPDSPTAPESSPAAPESSPAAPEGSLAAPEERPEMPGVEIDGYLYVGYLSIPAIELELPVMSEWDYTRLKIAPCRYAGSTETGDLVICAHNYTRHFGQLKNLAIGDVVTFTGMDGTVSAYEVVSLETLAPTAVEEMTGGGYDLTLFTCTYGGATRITVRCDRAAAEDA